MPIILLIAFLYPAEACEILVPVVLIQVTDHNAARGGSMNEVIVCQVDANMGDVPAVYMEENEVALFGIFCMLDTLTVMELLHGSA